MRKLGTIKITSETWDLYVDPKSGGGEFSCGPYQNKRNPHIIVGSRSNNPGMMTLMLLHEILEAILTNDGKRFQSPTEQLLFVFDHEYLNTIPAKLLDAMLSSGWFSLNVGRIKAAAKKR